MVATCYFQPLSEESSSTVLDQLRESVAKITVTPQKKATAEMLDQSAINEEGLCASMRNVVEITPRKISDDAIPVATPETNTGLVTTNTKERCYLLFHMLFTYQYKFVKHLFLVFGQK